MDPTFQTTACDKSQPYLSTEQATRLLQQCDEVYQAVAQDLEEARVLVDRAGLSVESSILDPTFPTAAASFVLRTTGGHSNTDHVVTYTGNPRVDRIAELKRAFQRRTRATQPEHKGAERWDKPRIPGERRRRIQREKDMPSAPPEPPTSGYGVFVCQMTTKIRHDRPNKRHNQPKVMKEISKIWITFMSEHDKEYYHEFAREAREEYQEQHQQFRATGLYTPSKTFEKLSGVGPWVRIAWHEKNSLEREIASYETVQFPLRPPEYDEEYRQQEEKSKRMRKEKERARREALGIAKRRRVKAPLQTKSEPEEPDSNEAINDNEGSGETETSSNELQGV